MGTTTKSTLGGAGRGQGRKPSPDAKLPLGVNRVAPDVAALVAGAAEGKTAYVEAAIRYYSASQA